MNGTTDLLSGLFPRFLIVSYFGKDRSIEDPPPASSKKRDRLVAALRGLANQGEREYAYSPEAATAKHKWLVDFDARMHKADPIMGAFYKKMRDDYFHKIAMLSAFERGSNAMSKDDVGEAIDLLWPIEAGWKESIERMTAREWDRDASRVEELIKERGELDRSDILQALRNIKAQKLTAILNGLYQDNKVQMDKSDTPGRPRSVIKWVKTQESQLLKIRLSPSETN